MDEIAELRDALDRLHAALDDLVVRGVRAAGARDLARLTALRDEFQAAGAEHLAGRLATLAEAIRADDRAASPPCCGRSRRSGCSTGCSPSKSRPRLLAAADGGDTAGET